MSLIAIFTLIALTLFVLATFKVGVRFNLTAAGLAFLTASLLVPMLGQTKDLVSYRPMIMDALGKTRDQFDLNLLSSADSSGMVTVKALGAKGDGVTNDTAAVAAADAATTGGVAFTPGTYLLSTTPTVTGPLEIYPGAVLTGPGAAPLGYATNALHQSIYSTAADQFASRYIRRNANHVGGTAGFTSSALRVDNYVSAGVTNYEWATTFLLDNRATAGQNVAMYALGIKRATGPTWGAVIEVKDATGANPTTGAVGLELDVSANGSDNNTARIGIDLAVRKHDIAGADVTASYGVRIQNGNEANALVKTGYGFYPGMKTEYAFDASRARTTYAAFKLATNQNIIFSADNAKTMTHTGGAWSFNVSSVSKASIADSGAISVGANQVVGERVKGTPAVATDLASAIKLVNFMRSAGISHGSISK